MPRAESSRLSQPAAESRSAREALPEALGGEELLLEVSDTGPGIPADKLEYILEPCARVDESRTRVTSGTGLGLAIARRLAELLGGEASVRSRLGEGSTFTLRLPDRLERPAAG